MIAITKKNCIAAVEACQATFQASKATLKLKRIDRSIKPLVFLYGRRGGTLAQAYGLSLRSSCSSRKRLGLRESIHPSSLIGKRKYFMIIEVNPNAFSKYKTTTWKSLCVVIAHELAHLCDIICRKQTFGDMTSIDPTTDHDGVWKNLSKCYGGNDGPLINID